MESEALLQLNLQYELIGIFIVIYQTSDYVIKIIGFFIFWDNFFTN